MQRLTLPGPGPKSRATQPTRVSAPPTLGGDAEETGADVLEAARWRERLMRQPEQARQQSQALERPERSQTLGRSARPA